MEESDENYEMVDGPLPPASILRHLPPHSPRTKQRKMAPSPPPRTMRSPRDILPPIPPGEGVSASGPPHPGKVARSKTFCNQDGPPDVPVRRLRRSSEDPSAAPPVPTTPRPRIHEDGSVSSPLSKSFDSSGSWPHPLSHSSSVPCDPSDETMSLASFVRRFSDSLPLKVHVDKGFCGSDEKGGISAGDEYIIHFLKRTKMVVIADVNGHTYKFPLNSAVEFAPLYDPEDNFEKATRGYTFEFASEIIALKSGLPHVVRVLRSHQTSDPKSSISESELLAVKCVSKTTFTRRATLKVFSITTMEEKLLHEDCHGKFSTAAVNTRLYVPEILEYVSDALPITVAACLNVDSGVDLPAGLTSDAVTIEVIEIQTSLIATTYCEDDAAMEGEEDDDDSIPVEIPINLDIDVTILSDDDHDYTDTVDLFEQFNPSRVRTYTEGNYEDFHHIVRKGQETLGTEIQKPMNAFLNNSPNHRPPVDK